MHSSTWRAGSISRALRGISAGLMFGFVPQQSVAQENTSLLAQGPIVVDLLGGIEWMRCSIGQVWVDVRCDGDALLAPFAVGDAVVARATSSSGAGWRLPTHKELTSIVERNVEPPMISTARFPGTYAGGYWTGDKNRFLSGSYWIVNFNTGFSYGRAHPRQSYSFRLVRDRN